MRQGQPRRGPTRSANGYLPRGLVRLIVDDLYLLEVRDELVDQGFHPAAVPFSGCLLQGLPDVGDGLETIAVLTLSKHLSFRLQVKPVNGEL